MNRRKPRWSSLIWPLAVLLAGGIWFFLNFSGAGPHAASPAQGSESKLKVGSLLPPPNDYNFIHPYAVPCGAPNADLSYKVPLSPEQESRVMRVYRRSLVILAHTHCVEPWDFAEMRAAGVTAVILKVDVDGLNMVNGQTRTRIRPDEDWLRRGTRAIHRIQQMAAQPDSQILLVRSVADLHRAKREGKVGVILSFEGAKPLTGQLENVKHYYDLGMRELQLWWAVPNELKTTDGRRFSGFGEAVIREMNRLGIVIDLSHITGQAFAQAISWTNKPMIVSHCAVGELRKKSAKGDTSYSGTDHLNDATIRAIARNGGSICVHFVTPDYILPRHGTKKATVVDLVDHIAYVRDLVGIDYVSLGADFFPEQGWQWVEGAGRISLLANVAREMRRRGFGDEEVRKVLGENLVRVFEKNWEPSPKPGS